MGGWMGERKLGKDKWLAPPPLVQHKLRDRNGGMEGWISTQGKYPRYPHPHPHPKPPPPLFLWGAREGGRRNPPLFLPWRKNPGGG